MMNMKKILPFGSAPGGPVFIPDHGRTRLKSNVPFLFRSDGTHQAVNALRLSNGLPALNAHPVLMQIAQTEVEGIAAGMGGHWRPNNITLGQWLLSLGYPLSGDLSLDGYRSENWITGPGLTVQDAIRMWSGDDPHLNTMLSPHRSDIGAGVATSMDEWGQTVIYYVLETALQTTSGQMQSDAYPTLTAIALGQVTVYGDATQAAQSLLVPQYILPVVRATARPDGDVIHEVKNGQSLWSIAIEYGVKIEQIRLLNNLSSTDIYTGEKLLVQKGATQPMPTSTVTKTPVVRLMTVTPDSVSNGHSPTNRSGLLNGSKGKYLSRCCSCGRDHCLRWCFPDILNRE